MRSKPNNSPFKETLRLAGLKATPGRIKVLTILDSSKKPLSVNDLLESLKTKLDQATIYRMMEVFEKKGIIRYVDFKHGHSHFEMNNHSHHHHLVCTSCGLIVDISKCNIGALEKEALKLSGFSGIQNHSLELFGTCKKCDLKNRKK